MKALILLLFTFLTILIACKKETAPAPLPEEEPEDTALSLTPFELNTPMHFPRLALPVDNPPYYERIMLGRMLYYDPILSNDGRACASCHLQSKGFTIDSMVGGMPVLPHVNLAWNTNFMWNGAKPGTLEDVMLFEVRDFFGTDLGKVNNSEKYRELFKKHFGVDQITYKELAYSLAQFARTMISRDTRYDRFIRGAEQLTYDEMEGRRIFFTEKGDCFHCHINPVMTDNLFHNTGLDGVYDRAIDKGLYNITRNLNDMGKFKTPNLRNAGLRSRFMHDGRYSSLEEVIEFYNSGVNNSSTLDPIMTKPGKENGLNLTPQEKYQLLQFLMTLTDESFLADTSLAPLK